ncbi:MAG: hypothetical protein HYY28_09440 [Betaproteobacteria bacterium]|nr:hypothetical protein [Betaproteobacteria bacterium]
MKTRPIVAALGIVAGMAAAPLVAADNLVQFDGGIGVIPVSSGVGQAAQAEVVNRNIVRGVQPAGQPWVIRVLRATVRAGGAITVDGRGLLLGGGNNIGGNPNNPNVFATLICEAAAPFTERNTNLAGVRLDPNGDFRIDDVLDPAPVDCASPVLLIRNTNLVWFAAGIPKRPELPEPPSGPQILFPIR